MTPRLPTALDQKEQELQRPRTDTTRLVLDTTARLQKQQQRVVQTETFMRLDKRELERREQAQRETGALRRELRRKRLDTVEGVALVWRELAEILQELEAEGLDTLSTETVSDADIKRAQQHSGVPGPMGARLVRVRRLLKRLLQIEMQTKTALQYVLAGGTGLPMLSTPQLTFKRLFERLRQWPKRIPPGRRPETDAEFDLFIAWVFEPAFDPGAEIY